MSSDAIRELQEAIKNSSQLHVYGARTKTGLHQQFDGIKQVSTSRLRGVVSYDPQEFVITVLAGTQVSEVIDTLAQQGQYLPFDPMLSQRGATIGGTVASNAAGSGRFRFGGVRDFLLGIRFIDGRGNSIRGGGQVVKNAAGFDYPKLMVGSQGKLGLIYELTFKVFPRPESFATEIWQFDDLDAAMECMNAVASSNLDAEALDLMPNVNGSGYEVTIRIGGIASAIPNRLLRLQSFVESKSKSNLTSMRLMMGQEEHAYWLKSSNLTWAAGESVIKVPITPKMIPELERSFATDSCVRRYCVGGNIAWIACSINSDRFGKTGTTQLFLGNANERLPAVDAGPFGQAIKRALDPEMKLV